MCPSVFLTNSGIVANGLNVGSRKQCCPVSDAKDLCEIPTGDAKKRWKSIESVGRSSPNFPEVESIVSVD